MDAAFCKLFYQAKILAGLLPLMPSSRSQKLQQGFKSSWKMVVKDNAGETQAS